MEIFTFGLWSTFIIKEYNDNLVIVGADSTYNGSAGMNDIVQSIYLLSYNDPNTVLHNIFNITAQHSHQNHIEVFTSPYLTKIFY